MKEIETEEKKQKEEKKKIAKEIEKKISNKVFINLLIAIIVMAYFCGVSVLYGNVGYTDTINIVKITTMVFLAIALVLIEIAYKKESKRLAIHAFEILALAVHSLTTVHITKIYSFDFAKYILWSSYAFSIYYVLKTIIINTKARRDYLNDLSDISEIVQKDEPLKKEATKKKKEEIDEQQKEKIKEVKEENKSKLKSKTKSKEKKPTKPESKEENIIPKEEKVEEPVKEVVEEKTDIEDKEEIKSKTRIKNKKIAGLWEKLEKLNEEDNIKDVKKDEPDVIKENNKKVEENKTETPKVENKETEQQKPKKKRGRPKKEVKVND